MIFSHNYEIGLFSWSQQQEANFPAASGCQRFVLLRQRAFRRCYFLVVVVDVVTRWHLAVDIHHCLCLSKLIYPNQRPLCPSVTQHAFCFNEFIEPLENNYHTNCSTTSTIDLFHFFPYLNSRAVTTWSPQILHKKQQHNTPAPLELVNVSPSHFSPIYHWVAKLSFLLLLLLLLLLRAFVSTADAI